MKFKQNWSILRQMRMGLCVISAISIPYGVYLLFKQEWKLALVLLFIELFLAGCFCFTARAIPGGRTNEIVMDTSGITLHQDGEADLFFPWNEIASVRKSRRYGTNTLVVTNRTGKEIWFFTSRKIERYINAYKTGKSPL
jgi:hypothetical protein